MKTNLEIDFDASNLSGGAEAILGPSQCGPDVVKLNKYTWYERPIVKVNITLDETDPRVPKVLTLLAEHGIQRWLNRRDIYTEDELQAAPLLVLERWILASASGGEGYGTTYDTSKGCPKCGTGIRQTSAMNIDRDHVKTIEKYRIAGTVDGDLLVRDVDVEKLLAAGVTGALFWPVYAETKAGNLEELRWQQMFIEHVMPPMSPKSLLDRTKACPVCGRGWFTQVSDYPTRFVYRREDLTNIQDVNVTCEWFGEPPWYSEGVGRIIQGPRNPWKLVTPKVMNLLRAKTKKEAKTQGCDFIPIWIEEANGTTALA